LQYLKTISVFFIFNICLVFSFHFIIGDLLFFLSDYYSIFVYVGFFSLLLLLFEFYFILKKKSSLINLFTQFLILLFFLYYFLNYVLNILFQFLEKIYHFSVYFLTEILSLSDNLLLSLKSNRVYIENFIKFILIFVFLYFIFKLFKNKNKFSFKIFDNKRQKRTEVFAILVFFVINIFLLVHYFYPKNLNQSLKQNKNIVLIVLDALSADLLKDYGNSKTQINFNEKYNASIFLNFRTLYPHTAHFFKFFYSGSPNVESFSNALQQKKLSLKKIENRNLIKSLQEKGVLTKLHIYHRSGIPEGTDYGINDYKGLRSYYLTDKLVFIPKIMKLDYHLINSTSTSISKKLKYNFQKNLRKFFTFKTKKNDLLDILYPNLINLSKQNQPFFLIFHQRWDEVTNRSDFKNYYDPDEEFEKKDQSYCSKANKILKKRDMTYDSIFEDRCLELINKNKIATAKSLELAIDEFINKVKRNNSLKDIEIIITSDHGYMTAKNKLSYGYHNDELVVKVPLMIFNNKSEINVQNFFTLDLVSYILNNYGLNPKEFYEHAIPLTKAKRNFPTYSISRPGQYYKKWMLSYYLDNKKYEINLHKEGMGEFNIYEIDNFRQNKIGSNINNKNKNYFKIILSLLGLKKDNINPDILN